MKFRIRKDRRAVALAATAAITVPALLAGCSANTSQSQAPVGSITVTSISAAASLPELGEVSRYKILPLEGAIYAGPQDVARDAAGAVEHTTRGGVAWREDRYASPSPFHGRGLFHDRLVECAYVASPEPSSVVFRYETADTRFHPSGEIWLQTGRPGAPGKDTGAFDIWARPLTPEVEIDAPTQIPLNPDGTSCVVVSYTGVVPLSQVEVNNEFGTALEGLSPDGNVIPEPEAAEERQIRTTPAARLPRVLADTARKLSDAFAAAHKASRPTR